MTDQPIHHQLSDIDAQAIDALVAAGFDAALVPESTRERAVHAAKLLGMMDGPIATDSALVDLTLARVLRSEAAEVDAVLCGDDREALDAYVAAEFRIARVPQSLRPRAERIESLVQLVSQTEPTSKCGPALVERTMRKVAAARMDNLEPIPIRGGGGFRFADLISVAAVILMGVGVLWPVLSTVRTYQQKNSCEANLGSIASALGTYASDNRAAFPMATASYGGTWLDVGSTPDRSNSSNLFTLAKAGYARLRDLACSGNSHAVTQPSDANANDWRKLPEVSYSYYIMFGKNRPTMNSSGATILLADKSPVAIQFANHQEVHHPQQNSPNHGGRGEWALRTDGAAAWLTSPTVGGDNIWLNNKQQATLESLAIEARQRGAKGFIAALPAEWGSELPESPDDSFLGP